MLIILMFILGVNITTAVFYGAVYGRIAILNTL